MNELASTRRRAEARPSMRLRVAALLALAVAAERAVVAFDKSDFLRGTAPRAYLGLLLLQALLAAALAFVLGLLATPNRPDDRTEPRVLRVVAVLLIIAFALIFAKDDLMAFDYSS